MTTHVVARTAAGTHTATGVSAAHATAHVTAVVAMTAVVIRTGVAAVVAGFVARVSRVLVGILVPLVSSGIGVTTGAAVVFGVPVGVRTAVVARVPASGTAVPAVPAVPGVAATGLAGMGGVACDGVHRARVTVVISTGVVAFGVTVSGVALVARVVGVVLVGVRSVAGGRHRAVAGVVVRFGRAVRVERTVGGVAGVLLVHRVVLVLGGGMGVLGVLTVLSGVGRHLDRGGRVVKLPDTERCCRCHRDGGTGDLHGQGLENEHFVQRLSGMTGPRGYPKESMGHRPA
ncbi:hypothetical protein [Mycolicibacterium phlei]|uniref:Uncharacterized protein n=1 Tax=Mycolicibacterium phlei DSM 43239 = CCUG 21000 TaxID=1226750 RepID=A0A5N5V1P1_MYCPH|nr:hypothetical protein [Mycolicibacterium phlei]KXW66668.1 hypothetical protein MPHL43070_20850 [Mycolicibacterium phlei DSM 43070]KXW66839.1 hypothetical protein MPHL43072_24195 [Mycolicibacterium phlei DSM 43072]KAB7754380.1 hypothetical protein MPHL21000_16860 [Mycolicibacterium phlei DSM 43239 = CCUG 21000]KXW63974.1 hypothetical protein MPHL43239_14345 [Mycolicibacterium phlei DSM 43239 = CCUG 21000]KXW77060.1 hypothetical protein JL15_13545 [Mycolicibacterium phlei DSM 43071]